MQGARERYSKHVFKMTRGRLLHGSRMTAPDRPSTAQHYSKSPQQLQKLFAAAAAVAVDPSSCAAGSTGCCSSVAAAAAGLLQLQPELEAAAGQTLAGPPEPCAVCLGLCR